MKTAYLIEIEKLIKSSDHEILYDKHRDKFSIYRKIGNKGMSLILAEGPTLKNCLDQYKERGNTTPST